MCVGVGCSWVGWGGMYICKTPTHPASLSVEELTVKEQDLVNEKTKLEAEIEDAGVCVCVCGQK